MVSTFALGHLLGHVQTLPDEPKPRPSSFFDALSPEMKVKGAELLQQGLGALSAWFAMQKAAGEGAEARPEGGAT